MIAPWELYEALDALTVIYDTREQNTKSLCLRLEQIGNHRRDKLNFGDYSADVPLPNGAVFTLRDKVAIERKMSIDELCHCFCQDRERFEREFERAKEVGAKIVLLIENATWEGVYNGRYRSKMKNTALVASILAFLARYNCQIIFCKPETTGKLIKDILYREAKEILQNGDGR